MCSICLHYCNYYHSWSLRRSQTVTKCQHEEPREWSWEEQNESTDFEEDDTEEGEDEQDNDNKKEAEYEETIQSSSMMMVW